MKKLFLEFSGFLFIFVSQFLAGWVGNVLADLFKFNSPFWLLILPCTLIGAFFAYYSGEKLKKQAEKGPDNVASNSKNTSILIAQGLALSVIPGLFYWCEDRTLGDKAAQLFIALIPLAVSMGQAYKISSMLDNLYSVGHEFLNKFILSSRIRHKWLYIYLLDHPASKDFDNETLERFSRYKLHLWAHERKDFQIVDTPFDTTAVRRF